MRHIQTNSWQALGLAFTVGVGALSGLHGCKGVPKTDEKQSQTAALPAMGAQSAANSATPTTVKSAAPGAATPADGTAPVVEDWMPPRQFVQSVARHDMLQMALGELAREESNAPTVKDLGRRMVANHTAIQVIIAKLAKSEGVALPDSLPAEDQALIAKFASMQRVEFAKAYATLMADRNGQMLAMFKWQCENCTEPEIKTFAAQTMPIMGTHSRLSDALNQEFNKEELRLAAEQKAAEIRATEIKKAQDTAAAEARAARRAPKRK